MQQVVLERSMIHRTMKITVRDWGRILLIPFLLLYLLLPVLTGNSLVLCVSNEDHVALEFGSSVCCFPSSQGDTSNDHAGECNDRQCESCIDYQLSARTSIATPGHFESLSVEGEGLPSFPAFYPTERSFVARQDSHPEIRPPAAIHSVLSTIVLLI